MSDVHESLDRLVGHEAIHLRPEDIQVDGQYNVRPWSTQTEAEDVEIDRLADNIASQGQIQPVMVVPRIERNGKPRNGDGETHESFYVYDGLRRRRAIQLINSKRSATSNGTNGLLQVWCVVDRSGGDPRQKAFSANQQRKNMASMDIATLIQELRKEHGPDAAGTAKIAKYLGVSKLNVTQHERLLKPECSHELRESMKRGAISLDTAIEIMNSNVPLAKHGEVVKLGKQIQDQEALERISEDPRQTSMEVKQARLDKVLAKTRVQEPSIKKAIRLVQPKAGVRRGDKDVVEFFNALDGPGYGHPNGAVRVFIRYFLDEWKRGDGEDKVLAEKFDAMVKGAHRGSTSVGGVKASPKATAKVPVKKISAKEEAPVKEAPVKVAAKTATKPAPTTKHATKHTTRAKPLRIVVRPATLAHVGKE